MHCVDLRKSVGMSSRTVPAVRGDILRAIRRAQGHGLLALSTDTGIHQTTLSLIEHGHRPGRPHLTTLADHLGIPTAVLAGQTPAIAALRAAHGITPDDLARATGITPERLADIEAGAEHPDTRLARRLAVRLDVPVSVVQPRVDTGAAA